MNWLLKLNRTTRLGLLSAVLGVVGALGAQVFLWMLHVAEAGLLTGISGYSDISADAASRLTQIPSHPLLWLVPVATTLGGLLSGWLVYTFAPEAEGHGTDAAVASFHRHEGKIRPRIFVVKSVASAITIGSGGAAGREGPTAQIAATIGSILGRLLNLSAHERRYLVLVGMAAGLSAIFKSPLGTAIFAVEILYSTMAFEGEALTFTLIGAAVAYAINGLFEGWTPLFALPSNIGFTNIENLAWYGLLAVVAGLLGAVIPTVFYRVRDAFHKIPVPPHVKPAIGGLVVGLIGIFVPELLGGGYGYMQFALQGTGGMAIWFMLALALGKLVALSLTVGSGGSGGVFAPTLFIGTLLGAAFAAAMAHFGVAGIHPTGMAVVGMAAVFAGAARVPIASMVMVAEMTGGYSLIMPAMFAVAISYLVQSQVTRNLKYRSLYEAQVSSHHHSPVHYQTYYRAVADLLRKRKVRLDKDIFDEHFQEALTQGDVIPIRAGDGGASLYTLRLPTETHLDGAEVRSLGLQDILIASIVRNGEQIIPTGGTCLYGGDWLILAARPQAMQEFERRANNTDDEPLEYIAPGSTG